MSYAYDKKSIYDFIWNITLVCPWNCEFCCTDSVHVAKSAEQVVMFEKGLSEKIIVSERFLDSEIHQKMVRDGVEVTRFDLALQDRQRRGKELRFHEKISLLSNLSGNNVEIDFAGGDPLSCYENFLTIKEASTQFGRENISITSTGFSINRYGVDTIADIIGEFEFTLDEITDKPPTHRPKGYNASNLHYAKLFAEKGLKTKAQLPIHSGNFSYESIKNIYLNLAEGKIDELLLMRTFPVGRGRTFILKNGMYFQDKYLRIIEAYRELEAKYHGPHVRLQCALKHLEPSENKENPCDLMRNSYGINPKGNLLLSAWATNNIGEPLSEHFVLGDLHKSSFRDLLSSPKALNYFSKLDNNYGHCKIFSYFFSPGQTADEIFVSKDPLYENQ